MSILAQRYRDVMPLKAEYSEKKERILRRLDDFREVGLRSDRELFEELAFCLLAIQTKARVADATVRALVTNGSLWLGAEGSLAHALRHRVRFHNHKATYLVRARERFFPDGRPGLRRFLDGFASNLDARAGLVREIDGLGLKEASHFLRNIGRGDGLAILDRHVLRNLQRHRVIGRLPASLTARRYLRIEETMRAFSDFAEIPMEALDLVFWCRETGEIFK